MGLPLREAVRAIVVDENDRLLLVRFGLVDGPLWAAPGGGVEPGESHETAIQRELHEEVGLQNPVVGPAIWTRTHQFSFLPEFGGQHETFYLVRVQGFAVSPAFSESELLKEGLTGSRWWTLAELKDSSHLRCAPKRLPDLFASLLANGPPSPLVDAGE
jgi:8-oxo-dGTP diphosphatase